jgi:hypothetical protein
VTTIESGCRDALGLLRVEILDLRQKPRVDRVRRWISSRLMPIRKASQCTRSVPACLAERHLDFLAVGTALVEAIDTDLQTAQAFCSDSWKVRPMAITSPTDFICVVRRESASGTSRRQNAAPW